MLRPPLQSPHHAVPLPIPPADGVAGAASAAAGSREASAPSWAQVLTATFAVAVAPIAVVWLLRADGVLSSPLLAVLVGMALSLLASQLGCRLWQRRAATGDVLFNELLVWGQLRRRHDERQLASAYSMLGASGRAADSSPAGELSVERQARLLERLVAAVETRDSYLHGHSQTVARQSWSVARRMGLSRAEVARIRTAAALHDVGKINTPAEILHKPGRLTDEEFDVIRRHTADGAEIVAVLRDPGLEAIVRHHHERLDGSGYPDGVRGEAISIGARIVAVVDTFDAITSIRPYRPARTHEQAFAILRAEAGTKLDADVVHAFCAHYSGRRTVALSSALAGAADRIGSWLGAGAGTAAAAAKGVALAALIGGTAATTSTLAYPARSAVRSAPARAGFAGTRAGRASHASGDAVRRSGGGVRAGSLATGSPRAGAASSAVGARASGAGATSVAVSPTGASAGAATRPEREASTAPARGDATSGAHRPGSGATVAHGVSSAPVRGHERARGGGAQGAQHEKAPASPPGLAKHEASGAPGASGEAHGNGGMYGEGSAGGETRGSEAHGSGESADGGAPASGHGEEHSSEAAGGGGGAGGEPGHGAAHEQAGAGREAPGQSDEAHGSGVGAG